MIRRTFLSSLLAPLLARFAPKAKAAPTQGIPSLVAAPALDAHLILNMTPRQFQRLDLLDSLQEETLALALEEAIRDCPVNARIVSMSTRQEPTMRFDPPIIPSGELDGRLDVRYVNGRIISTWCPPEEQK